MTAILILLPVVLVLGGVCAGLFLYAARSGQFDDLDDPPERILHDWQHGYEVTVILASPPLQPSERTLWA